MHIYPYSENKKSPIHRNRAFQYANQKLPLQGAGGLFLHPAILQGHRAVKHQMIRSGIFV